MKPPKTVTVGPFTFGISVHAGRLPAAHWGLTDKGRLTITLHPDQADQMLRATMLHEVLHAACHVVSLDDDGAEERIATALAPVLLETLRANPDLVAFLTD